MTEARFCLQQPTHESEDKDNHCTSQSSEATVVIESDSQDFDLPCEDSSEDTPITSLEQLFSSPCPSVIQIAGDKLYLEIKTKHITLTGREKSLHWFHLVRTEE